MSHILVPVLPFMLSFAAGAMFFVVIKELIPDFSDENKFRSGIFSFYIGFIIMMSLDVALG
jgi:ZIP family zinc transporter